MITCLLLAFMAQSAASPRDVARSSPSAAGIVTGRVLDNEPQPQPLRRARVTLAGPPTGDRLSAITGDDGVFTFAAVPAGSYRVVAEKAAYVPVGSPRRLAVFLGGGETARLDIHLQRGGVITGTVLDLDGAPMRGIDVRAYDRRFSAFTAGPRYVPAGSVTLPSDDRGVYRIFGLPSGEYVVAAMPAAPGNTPITRVRIPGQTNRRFTPARVFYPSTIDATRAVRVAIRAGEERGGIDIQLQYVPLASVSGTVDVPGGYARAEVAIGPLADSGAPVPTGHGMTVDDSGRFSFANLTAGPYRISARARGADGAVAAVTDVTLEGEDVDNVVLSLRPTLTITGLLVFRGDHPVAMFSTTRTEPPLLGLAEADALMPPMEIDGVRFRIDGVLPGPFRLGTNIRGIREPMSGWWLTSIAAGDVELLDLPSSHNIEGAIAIFSDRVSELTGLVTDARGVPLAEVPVIAFSRNRAAWFALSRRIAASSSDANGRYAIRNLPPGDYYLAASGDLPPEDRYAADVLERLSGAAVPLTVIGTEAQVRNLTVR